MLVWDIRGIPTTTFYGVLLLLLRSKKESVVLSVKLCRSVKFSYRENLNIYDETLATLCTHYWYHSPQSDRIHKYFSADCMVLNDGHYLAMPLSTLPLSLGGTTVNRT